MINNYIASQIKLSKKIKIKRLNTLPTIMELENDNSDIELEVAEKIFVTILSRVRRIRGLCNYSSTSISELISNKSIEVEYITKKNKNKIIWSYINKNLIKETTFLKNSSQVKYYKIEDCRFTTFSI